ncbi:unnamed protein product [Symbiodinium natans]|uniref:RNA-editing substrate-binding complex 6 protein domain-containing protein n=1 Tax=Symbiodinium natans TaxID=878477 RepID=A0A812UZ21_9DINO|nr:unnamed protein product [Symbiodinium natans]
MEPGGELALGGTIVRLCRGPDSLQNGCEDTTGFQPWGAASRAAAALLPPPAPRLQLELGAGLGALGVRAAPAGFVVLSDKESAVLGLALGTAALNAACCDAVVYDFARGAPPFRTGVFDLLLASDVLFMDRLAEPLFASLAALHAPSQRQTAIVGHQKRRAVFRGPDGQPCLEPEDSALGRFLDMVGPHLRRQSENPAEESVALVLDWPAPPEPPAKRHCHGVEPGDEKKDVSPVNQTPKGLRLNNESLPHVEVVEIVLSEQAQLLLAGSFACIGVLPLTTIFHRAYVAGDHAKLRELNPWILQKLHLLRPREVAMVLNHLAFLQVLDHSFWQTVSDRVPEILISSDMVCLSLMVNAYARGALKHEATLQFLAAEVMQMAARGGEYLPPRTISMVVNGMSKLRIRDEKLMKTMSIHARSAVADMTEVDLSMVANAYARLWINDQKLFDALEEPVKRAMPRFTILHLTALAHAHGRLLRRDEEMLQAIASTLWQRCESSQEAVDALNLSATMHAFATRLAFSSSDFVKVVEFSLPQVIEEMSISDFVLTVCAARRIEGLAPSRRLCEPLFRHSLHLLRELQASAVVNILELAAQLQHDSSEFWQTMLSHCATMLETSRFYEAQHISTLALLLARLWRGSITPSHLDLPDELKTRCFVAVATALLELNGNSDIASLADVVAESEIGRGTLWEASS